MSDPTHFEPLVPAGHVPLDYIAVVEYIVVAEIQPSVIRPSEQGNLILIGLGCRRCPREPAVRNDDVHTPVMAEETGCREIVELGEVRAAVPLDGQAAQFLQRPIISLVAAPELLNIKPGVEGRGEHVQGFLQKLGAQLRVVLGLLGIVDHLLGPDALPPSRVTALQHHGVGIVHLTAVSSGRRCNKDKDAVRRIAGYRSAENLPAVFHTLRAESGGQLTAGADADDQLVGIGLCRVLKHLVLLWRFVGVHLVGNHNIAVKGVLLVHTGG